MNRNLSVRITVLLEEKLVEKLRIEQAKLIRNAKQNVSFSQVLNQIIKKGLK